MHTLNRMIEADGVTYAPGTPLSELPPRIRGSVVSVGWVSDAPSPAADSAPEAAPDPAPDPAPGPDPAPKPKRSRAKA